MSLVGHWKLDEISGTTIKDSAGSNDGTWVGTELITNGDFSAWSGAADPDNEPDDWDVVITGGADGSNKLIDATNACQLISDGTLVEMSQNILTAGKAYSISINVTAIPDGALQITYDSAGVVSALIIAAGETGGKTAVFTALPNGVLRIKRQSGTGAVNATFTDVSVREVVDSVLGPVGVKTALLFDGVGDYIDTSDPFESTLQGSFSIELWVKLDDGQPGSVTGLVGVADRTGDDSVFTFAITTGGAVAFIYTSEGNSGNSALTGTILSDGAQDWIHFVIVADSTVAGVGGKKVYMDSIEQTLSDGDGDTSGVTFGDFTSAENLIIGGQNEDGTPGSFIGGVIKGIRIYNIALSAAQIHQLWNEGVRAGYRGRGRGRNR